MGIKERAQENPFMATLMGLAAVSVALSSIWSGVKLADGMLVTQTEAAAIHAAYDLQFEDLRRQVTHESRMGQCRWLSDKIDRLEYEIYQLERDNASRDFIQSKRQQLEQERRRFNALNCASLI